MELIAPAGTRITCDDELAAQLIEQGYRPVDEPQHDPAEPRTPRARRTRKADEHGGAGNAG